jgi:undecaprenyl-diphosphatase
MVSFGLLTTAALLFSTKKKKKKLLKKLNQRDALVIGVFQALAILPGVSRSGATISAGIWQGLNREEAFEFSFFLAIPAIIGAMFLQLFQFANGPAQYFKEGILGMILAGVVGYFCLKLLKKTLLSKKFWLFGVYCLVLGAAVFLAA